MAETLLFRGGSSASIDLANVQSREIVIDTDTDQIVSGSSKKKTVMEDSNGNISIDGTAEFAGDVGIGTTSKASNTHLDLYSTSSFGQYIRFRDEVGAPGLIGYTHTDDALRFYTANTEKLAITSAGLVGIGTRSPDSRLVVKSSATPATIFRCINSANNINIFQVYENSTGDAEVYIKNTTGAPNIALRATGSSYIIGGSLGIGTTSPSEQLEVYSTSDHRLKVSRPGTAIELVQPASASPMLNASGTGVALRFGINDAEGARLDASGRLLVGTSSSFLSYAGLQIKGTIDSGAHIGLANKFSAPTDGSNIGSIRFTNDVGGIGGLIGCEADGAWTAGSNYRSRLLFSTTADGASSPTERVRIKSDGVTSFGQGATAPGAGVAGTLINAGDGGILITNNTEPFLRCYTFTGGFPNALQIAANGNVTNANNSYGAISDIKLKENIVDANSQWDDLKALRVRNYNFKEGQTHTQIGLVAQEVELVSPGLVSESPDRDTDGNDLGTVTKSVNYSVLYMKAVKALQEAMERIEVLEAKVNALEGN
jgi:hypothetical protein